MNLYCPECGEVVGRYLEVSQAPELPDLRAHREKSDWHKDAKRKRKETARFYAALFAEREDTSR